MRSFFPVAMAILSLLPTTHLFSQLPIKPARTISFDTDEGTNMNIDISPDGKTLVFDLLGDLYTLPATGGQAVQLTRGLAINEMPIWSPDGKKIAYYTDYSGSRHLAVRDVSGSFQHILNRSETEVAYDVPVWTQDGNFIANGRSVYAITGSKQDLPLKFARILRVSLDNETVFSFEENGTVCRQDLAHHSKRPFTSPLNCEYIKSIVLSPDTHWLAYIVDSNLNKCLVVKNITTNSSRTLVPALFQRYPYYKTRTFTFNPCHFAFSPDSKSIYIGYGGKIHRIEIATGDDHTIPFTVHIQADLGALNYHSFPVTVDSLQVKYTRSANRSPDGKHLVFSALNKIYIMDLPDGTPHVLVYQPVSQYQPKFSPDGKWIAYISWCDTAGGALWQVPVSGGQPEKLTHDPGYYQRPAWSPDRNAIAVLKGAAKMDQEDARDASPGQLLLIALHQDFVKVIDDIIEMTIPIAFSTDGSSIIYGPGKRNLIDSGIVLVSKDLKGDVMTRLIKQHDRRALYLILGRSVSPDGRFFTYSLGEDIYVVPINQLRQSAEFFDKRQLNSIIRLGPGVDPCWEQGGKSLSWSYVNRFYTVNMDKVMTAAANTVEKNEAAGVHERDIIDIDIHPDHIIDLPVSAPKSYGHGTLVLKNVRILTMQNSKIIEHGTIVIKDGRFTAVGEMNSVPVPADAKVLDISGFTVMPGFIDVHVHMRLPNDVFPQQSWKYLASLAYGTTTVREPASHDDAFGYAELLETGQMIGPRLYSVGRAVDPFYQRIPIENFQDLVDITKKRAALGAACIKQYLLTTRLQKQWLLLASAQLGLNMTNEGDYSLISQLAMIKDGSSGVEHKPEFGDVYNDVIQFMARSGTYLTPTLQVAYGEEVARHYTNLTYWRRPDSKMRHFLPTSELEKIENTHPPDSTRAGFLYPSMIYADIRHHGGLVALGSHSENYGIGVHNELWALQAGGLTNMEALQSATILGARALGIQKDLGSIEVGKIADLVILTKNPLDDIHNSREIRYVMKDGVLYDGDTLDTIWPFVRKCPDWKLHEQAPMGK